MGEAPALKAADDPGVKTSGRQHL